MFRRKTSRLTTGVFFSDRAGFSQSLIFLLLLTRYIIL